MSKYIVHTLFIFSLAVILWGGQDAISIYAQTAEYVPLEPIPGIPTNAPDFPSLLRAAYQFLVGMSAAIAVLFITFSGIQYMLTDVAGTKEASKERIKNALVGLIFLLAIYLILATINPRLLEFNLSLKSFSASFPTETNTQQTNTVSQTQTPSIVINNAAGSGNAPIGQVFTVQTTRDGAVPAIITPPKTATAEEMATFRQNYQSLNNACRSRPQEGNRTWGLKAVPNLQGTSGQHGYVCESQL